MTGPKPNRFRSRYVHVRFLDVLVFVLSLAMIAVISVKAYSGQGKKSLVLITSPKGQWLFPVSIRKVLSVTDVPGGCVVSINNGSVRVIRSNCPRQICVRTGSISRPGQWIACMPHRVFIRIVGNENNPIDAVSF
ncbi:MAG: NusG domain II-containing protein [Spirochaetes bacterium]|nr:NusG domain II-containing protein [Spirochaetota bacterium]